MKTSLTAIPVVLAMIIITACAPAAPTAMPAVNSTPTAAGADRPIMHTTIGDFAVSSTRMVDKTRTDTAPEGFKFILIGLEKPDGQKLVAGKFTFESFQSMMQDGSGEVYLLTDDGTRVEYTGMGGWLDGEEEVADDFVFGFLVPVSASYTLYWKDNDPLPLSVD